MTSLPSDVISRLSEMAAVTSQWRGLLAVLSSTGARLDSAMTSHGAANTAAASPPAGSTRNCSHNSNLALVFFYSATRLPFSWRQTNRKQDTNTRLFAPVTLNLNRWPDLDIPSLHKGRYWWVRVWVAGKTVWSPRYTRLIYECVSSGASHNKAPYK